LKNEKTSVGDDYVPLLEQTVVDGHFRRDPVGFGGRGRRPLDTATLLCLRRSAQDQGDQQDDRFPHGFLDKRKRKTGGITASSPMAPTSEPERRCRRLNLANGA